MSQPPSLSDCCTAPCQCLVGIAETKRTIPKYTCDVTWGLSSGLMGKRAVGDRIIKRKHLFQMRPG